MRKKLLILSVLGLLMITSCSKKKPSVNNSSSDECKCNDICEIMPKETVLVKEGSGKNTYSSTVQMIKDVKPSVVDINAYGTNFQAAGSGVIVGKSDSAYYIITNHHVVNSATSFSINTYDENNESKEYSVTLVGSSPCNDIAVLKVETSDELKVATFIEDSSTCEIGEDVVAIGNPLGILGGSVTKGILSAKEREVYLEEIGYMNLMQTDAAINSGNSGGALFDEEGYLIGIVNSGYSSYEGLNFAIPGNSAKTAFKSIVDTYSNGKNLGYVVGDSNLGINLNSSSVYSSSSLNTQTNIVYLESLTEKGDAKKAGLKDYSSFTKGNSSSFYALMKVQDKNVTSLSEGIKLLQKYKAGETISLTFKEVKYKRDGNGFFGNTYYYLSDDVIVKDIVISQYVYSI